MDKGKEISIPGHLEEAHSKTHLSFSSDYKFYTELQEIVRRATFTLHKPVIRTLFTDEKLIPLEGGWCEYSIKMKVDRGKIK